MRFQFPHPPVPEVVGLWPTAAMLFGLAIDAAGTAVA
jgi:hypothetical protein